MRSRHGTALAALLLALPAALRAQHSDEALAARNHGFLDAARSRSIDSLATFFPREGTFTWIGQVRPERGRAYEARWRLRASDVVPVFGAGGPLCQTFADPMLSGGLITGELFDNFTPWRQVRGTRFVPRARGAGSPFFIEWRREGDTWVVSALGDERGEEVYDPDASNGPDRPGHPALATSADSAWAADAAWFRDNEPITFLGLRYAKQGLPAAVPDGEPGRVGALGGVPLLARRGDADRWPELIFVPVDPGHYQAYEAGDFRPCRG